MCTKRQLQELRDDERGGVTVLCMLICLVAVISYIKFGHAFLQETLPLELHLGIIAILACACLFTIGMQLHIMIKGEQSPRQLRKTLRKQLKELSLVTTAALERLKEVEDTLSWQSRLVRPIAYDHGSRAQELISRLMHRGREVESLLASKQSEDLFTAARLMREPLWAHENCQESLIKVRPLPALAPDQWIPTLEQMLQATEFEVARAEEKIRESAIA